MKPSFLGSGILDFLTCALTTHPDSGLGKPTRIRNTGVETGTNDTVQFTGLWIAYQ